VGTSIPCPSRPIALSPTAKPTIAVAIGNAIAVTVPNVNSRMITAAAIPTASLDSVAGLETAWPR
jgi:hypothetical protein